MHTMIVVDRSSDERLLLVLGEFAAAERAIVAPRPTGEVRLDCPPEVAAKLVPNQLAVALVKEGGARGTPAVVAAYPADLTLREFRKLEALLSEQLGACQE